MQANNPFLIIKRCHSLDQNESVDAVKVYTTEYKTETTNPMFVIRDIRLQTLCNADEQLPIIFEVWSYDSDGNHKFYARFQTSVHGIQSLQRKQFELYDDNNNTAGVLEFTQFLVYEKPSIMDYLRSGWMISLSVAIDFTASNGELRNSSSLHYIDYNNPMAMNSYELAIYHVWSILEQYDSNRQFPVFGFGAIPRFIGSNEISHWFNLNGIENPEVLGVQGVLSAYRSAIYKGIGLYGPTNFSPCIETMMSYVKSKLNQWEYNVMVFVTDGAITDFKSTVDKIVEASYLPMSIIIIGVGEADFTAMQALDADNYTIKNSAGISAGRDVVQFVKYNQFVSDLTLLPEAVLKEIPNQFVSYMTANKIIPNPIEHLSVNKAIKKF